MYTKITAKKSLYTYLYVEVEIANLMAILNIDEDKAFAIFAAEAFANPDKTFKEIVFDIREKIYAGEYLDE